MKTTDKDECAERAYRIAREIIDQEWLAAGATREELEQDEQLTQLLDRLVVSGHDFHNLMADWQHKTPEAILREYASLVPALHNA